MESLLPEIIVLIGVIIAAIITGFFSFVSLINAKDQKVSEFRQDWINELREEISRYSTQATILAIKVSLYQKENQKNVKDFWNEHRKEHFEFFNCLNLIRLRVNPKKDKFIIDKVDEIYKMFSNSKVESNDVFKKCNNLIELSQGLLKKEWVKVKRGEWAHFITKWGTLIVFIASVIYAFVYLSAYFKI